MEVRDETTRGKKRWSEEDTEKAAEAIREQVMKNDPMEGKLVAVKFEKDGPVPYVRKNGKDVPSPLPKETWEDFPKNFKEKDIEPLHWIIDAQHQINQLPNRKLPLLMDEFFQAGFRQKQFRRLETFGLVRKHLIGVIDQKKQKSQGGKAKPSMSKNVIYLTSKGKAYMDHLVRIQKQ